VSSRPLAIAFVANGFPPDVGGTQLYNAEYARRLAALGHRVCLFTWTQGSGGPSQEGGLPFEVHREPRVLRRGRVEPGGLAARLAEWQPDVVFVSAGSRKLRRVMCTAAEAAPVVLAVHDLSRPERPRRGLRRWHFRRVYGLDRATRVAANSEDTRLRLLEARVPSDRIDLVHPGVDTRRFAPEATPGEARRRLGLEGRRVLLTVARLAPSKGHRAVIDLLPSLRRRVPELVYVIVGAGPTRAALEAQARALGVEGSVRFAGRVPDVLDYYRAGDVFVMASQRGGARGKPGEGFGMGYAEAGACGLPAVASSDGAGGEIVAHGETGYVVDPRDASALERALLELLRDRERARAMGEKARLRVQRFDWSVGAGELERSLRAAAEART
jgi:phosphatidylinositol alpha-1,6-mannosyltransferase